MRRGLARARKLGKRNPRRIILKAPNSPPTNNRARNNRATKPRNIKAARKHRLMAMSRKTVISPPPRQLARLIPADPIAPARNNRVVGKINSALAISRRFCAALSRLAQPLRIATRQTTNSVLKMDGPKTLLATASLNLKRAPLLKAA